MFDDVVVNAVAGGLSGITVDFILFPLDTVKTRLQARKVKNGQYSALRNAQGKLASKQSLLEGSSQILHSVKVALRTVEARGFYQGWLLGCTIVSMIMVVWLFIREFGVLVCRISLGNDGFVSGSSNILDSI